MKAAIKYQHQAANDADARRAERIRTKVYATVELNGRSVQGRIRDVSMSGMALDLEGGFFAASGTVVNIISTEVGTIKCLVRWVNDFRIGLEFVEKTGAGAQVKAYLRFFHRELNKPVLQS